MKKRTCKQTTVLFSLLLSASAAFCPFVSFGSPFQEEQERMRRREEKQQERMRQREEESKRRIEQGRNSGAYDLEQVVPLVQRSRNDLLFATQTAKAWSSQRSKPVPPEIMSQGKQYRSRVAAVEKAFRECSFMLHSPNYVVNDVLNRIAILKADAEGAVGEGDRLCFSVLNLYADEGREGLRGIDDDLKASAGSITRIRSSIQQMTIRDLQAAHERREAQEKALRASGQAKPSKGSENDEFRRRSLEYEEERKERKAKRDADEAKRPLEYRLEKLERSFANLSGRREQCEASLSSAVVSQKQYRSSRDDYTASDWNAALQGVQAELGAIETLRTDVAAFRADVADFEANASPIAKADTKPDGTASPDETPTTGKKPKRPTRRTPCVSWSPWDESAPSGAKLPK